MKPWVFTRRYTIKEAHQNVPCCEILDKIHRKLLTFSPAKIVTPDGIIYQKRTSRIQRPKTLKDVKPGTKKSVIYGGLFSKEMYLTPIDYLWSLVAISYIEISCDELERTLTVRISCLSGILGWMIFVALISIGSFLIFYVNSPMIVWITMASLISIMVLFIHSLMIFLTITNIKSYIRDIEEIKAY